METGIAMIVVISCVEVILKGLGIIIGIIQGDDGSLRVKINWTPLRARNSQI